MALPRDGGLMLEKLIDALLSASRLFRVCVVMRAYERGVVLRWGRFHREVGPGFHWLWPLNVEETLSANVVLETMDLGPQSLTTADEVAVVVRPVVTFTVDDVKKFLLEVDAAKNVIEDATCGILARLVIAATWDRVRSEEFQAEVLKKVRVAARKWGVDVTAVQFADLTRSRSLRLIQQIVPTKGVIQ